jgi:flavin-dependent dehydrogenase
VSPVFDVAVVGGGPAGSTVAALLAGEGFGVVLCDAARFPRHKVCGEYLPPAALRTFASLGVLDDLDRLGPLRHSGMAVVAPDGTEVLGRYGEAAPYGLALRRYDLDRVLLENARRRGALVFEGARLTGLGRRPDGVFDLALDGNPLARAVGPRARTSNLRARALVGADGRNSLVARRLGLRRPHPHRRFAIMGHFRDVAAPEGHGEMIITPYGYCGINPLPGGVTNVCAVLDPAGVGGPLPGRAGLAPFFRALLESHPLTRARMERACPEGDLRATGPLACRVARSVSDGSLLVGDAAGFFDPFTGEGIGMALRGAELAAQVLAEALRRGDLSRRSLAAYESLRRRAFSGRLRLDRLLQAIIRRPSLATRAGRKLRRDPRLADLLARVTAGTASSGDLLRPGFLGRLLLA